jgi:hypothetical protein
MPPGTLLRAFANPPLSGVLYAFGLLRVCLKACLTIIRSLKNIKHGELRISTSSSVYTFGVAKGDNSPRAELKVTNDTFWVRILTKRYLVRST